jgi:hypothetical protein
MSQRLICAAPDCHRGPKGERKEFVPRVRTQIYCSRTCSNRINQRRFLEKHPTPPGSPPGKPPGSVRFGRPKLEPTEAALPFERAAETTSDGPTKRAAA